MCVFGEWARIMTRDGHEAMPRLTSPEVCPVCGETVPRGSLACPSCGADHRSGWREDAAGHDGLGLPDEEFNYDEFVRGEFGGPPKPTARKITGWILLALVIAAIVLYLLGVGG